MDNKEIPPYDIPFDNNDPSENMNVGAGELEGTLSEDNSSEFLSDNLGMPDNIGETPAFQNNINDTVVSSENIRAAQNAPAKKGGLSIAVLIIILMFLFVSLFAVLLLLYADNLNIPFLSKKQNEIAVADLSNEEVSDINSLPSQEVEGMADGMENVMEENSEETGIEVTRNKNENRLDGGLAPDAANVNGQEGYPSLPNVNNKDQYANVRYYNGGTVGRLDPFYQANNIGNNMFEVIVPPIDPTPDQETQSLMSLRISGIMYTPDSPSAIINIAGQDQLVRSGDSFNGFVVSSITKDKVTVRTGKNTYTASVGEILNVDQVGINAIPNLNKKFAGAYNKSKDRIIEINKLD